jgi:hypothetical protein
MSKPNLMEGPRVQERAASHPGHHVQPTRADHGGGGQPRGAAYQAG